MIQYCGRDHQVTDRPSHKYICTIVKKARTKMEKQERILRDPSSRWVSGDPFIQDMGNFWGVVETRNYMRERLEIVQYMYMVDHIHSVETQLDNLLDMLRLSRRDDMSLRDMVPAHMIRLDMDQECYRFFKWWCVDGCQSGYEANGIEPP